jgi:ABC-type Co2+ transport system permease subunit
VVFYLGLFIKMPEQKSVAAPAGIDFADLTTRAVKYAFEGLAVAIAAYLLPGKGLKLSEIGMIALVALATFAILDIYAPSVGSSARTGAGFGIGAHLVGFP